MSDVFYVFGDFDLELAKKCSKWLYEKESDSPRQLMVYINSPGGDSFALQSMLDAMSVSSHTIITVGTGAIMSCGLELFIAGDYRLLFSNSTCLAHQFSWGTSGKYHELLVDTQQFTIEFDRQLEFYAKHSKLTKAGVKKNILKESDKFITAEEMIKYGLADELVTGVIDRKLIKESKSVKKKSKVGTRKKKS